MGIKSSIRRGVKYLPISSELQRAVALDEHADVGLDQGLEAVGEEAIEGLLPEDEVILDAEFEVEGEGAEGGSASKLDDLADKLSGDEPDAFTRLWAKGNEVLGDDKWKKAMNAIYKKLGCGGMKFSVLDNDAQDALLKAMEEAIEKGA
jgi:hypothetical protein